MRKSTKTASLSLACVLSTLFWLPGVYDANAQTFEVDTVELRIGYSAGGGYDRFGRLVSKHLAKHLPGNPSIVAKNEPGGGSLKLTKLVAGSKVSDGSLIALANPSMMTVSLLKPDKAQFDPQKLTWIGSLTRTSSLCVTSKESEINTMNEFLTEEFVVGATGKSSATYQFAALVKNLKDAKFKIVTGYPGGNDIMKAMVQGEVQARCGYSWPSLRKSSFADKVFKIGQIAKAATPGTEDVPLFVDQAGGDETMRQATDLILAPLSFSYPFFAPPGLSEQQTETLRKAFIAMTKDGAFVAEANKLGLDVLPTRGEDVSLAVQKLNAASPAVVEQAAQLLQ